MLRVCLEGFPDLAREMGLEVLDPDSVRERLSREGREDEVRVFGLIKVSGKLPTYPSPKPTFCPKREVSVNAREMGLEVLDPDSVRERLSREGREDEVRVFGSIMVSGNLFAYPSRKPTFCPKREVSVNAREMGLEVLDPDSVRERLSREGREDEVRVFGCIKVSGKKPTYPSPKPTFCPE